MASYLIKRILLILPTLFGIMLLNFIIIQFAPGGPVEQALAEASGFGNFSGTASVHRKMNYSISMWREPEMSGNVRLRMM